MARPVIRLDKISQHGANPNWGVFKGPKAGAGRRQLAWNKKKMKKNGCRPRTSRDIS